MTVTTLFADRDAWWQTNGTADIGGATTNGAFQSGTQTSNGVGRDAPLGKGTVNSKSGVHFDISSLSATVVAATLTLVTSGTTTLDAGEEMCARRITATWTESSGNLTDTTSGQTGAIGAVASYAAGYNATVSDAALVAIVEGWRAGTFSNFGLSIGTVTAPNASSEFVFIRTRETTTGNTDDPSLTVTTNSTPNTPTNLSRQAPNTDTTPVFQCDISDPDSSQQIKGRFTLYQSDGTTLIGTVESSFRTGAGTVTAEYTSGLSVGTYKVEARTVDDTGAVSTPTAQVTFTVTQLVTKDETLLWNVNQITNVDRTYLWNVQANNLKDLVFLWNTLVGPQTKDISLLWDIYPIWVDQPLENDTIPTWTKVVP